MNAAAARRSVPLPPTLAAADAAEQLQCNAECLEALADTIRDLEGEYLPLASALEGCGSSTCSSKRWRNAPVR